MAQQAGQYATVYYQQPASPYAAAYGPQQPAAYPYANPYSAAGPQPQQPMQYAATPPQQFKPPQPMGPNTFYQQAGPPPGAPPFKRTRYDGNGPVQQHQQQHGHPPPALPPVGGHPGPSDRGGHGGPRRGGGPSAARGGGPPGRGRPFVNGDGDHYGSNRDPGPRGARGRGDGRFGRPGQQGMSRPLPPPPLRGRPPLPDKRGPPPSGPRHAPNGRDNRRHDAAGARRVKSDRYAPAQTRDGRGSQRAPKDAAPPASRDEPPARRTLTDFRIAALSIPELGWEWRTDATVENDNDRQLNEGTELLADMSLDSVRIKVEVEDADDAKPPTEPARKKDGKHKRDEDDSTEEAEVHAKKARADSGDAVTLSEVTKTAVDVPTAPHVESVDAESEATQADSTSKHERKEATPAAESATRAHTLASRENSRLRIYFSSPASASSTNKRGTRSASLAPSTATFTNGARSSVAPTDLAEDDENDVDGEPIVDTAEDASGDVHDATVDPNLASKAAEVDHDKKAVEASSGEADPPSTLSDKAEAELASEGNIPNDEGEDDGASTTRAVSPSEAGTNAVEVETSHPPEPSDDRVSIAYARNTRRIIIDASVIEKLRIQRAEGTVELVVNIEHATSGDTVDGQRLFKGIILEALDNDEDDFVALDRTALRRIWTGRDDDDHVDLALRKHLPPFSSVLEEGGFSKGDVNSDSSLGLKQNKLTFVATLDRSNPLTEARWVKTGDVDNWLISLALANGQDPKGDTSQWRNKIFVDDPDPPPTIQHALDTWATSSNVGKLEERKLFVSDHMSDMDNVFEILLRLTRGDHHHHRSQPASPSQAASSVGVLAASLSAPYAEHQTQVSLAVLAMFRLSVETAQKAGIPRDEVEKQVGDIVRGIPYHLIFKSLDGMFREQHAKMVALLRQRNADKARKRKEAEAKKEDEKPRRPDEDPQASTHEAPSTTESIVEQVPSTTEAAAPVADASDKSAAQV